MSEPDLQPSPEVVDHHRDMLTAIWCPFCVNRMIPVPTLNTTSAAPADWRPPLDMKAASWPPTGPVSSFPAPRDRDPKEPWTIVLCKLCHEPMLYQDGDPPRVYPAPPERPLDQAIPALARTAGDEAGLCFSVRAFNACTTMARRAVQAAMVAAGATGRTLKDQIEDLRKKGHITTRIAARATANRHVGNSGAHPDPDEDKTVTEADARVALDLMRSVLEELFVLEQLTQAITDKHEP